jgi:dTDP-4-dehydrorhamnose reductase
MKRILVLGKNGFIGKSIVPLLKNEDYNVLALSHSELDFTNLDHLREFFRKNRDFDFVIHAALSGEGRLTKEDEPICLYENLLMLENLLYLSPFYDKLIFFNSAAKENRNKDVNCLCEGEFQEPPTSLYSLTKYISAKRILNNKKVIAFNVFNIFGECERENRFIKSNINNYIRRNDINIWGDKLFDFFYIKDAFTVINYFIKNPPEYYEELNLVYQNPHLLLSEVAAIINNLDEHKVSININEAGINKHYYGCGEKLQKLNLPLMGLKNGIREVYERIKILKEENGQNI